MQQCCWARRQREAAVCPATQEGVVLKLALNQVFIFSIISISIIILAKLLTVSKHRYMD